MKFIRHAAFLVGILYNDSVLNLLYSCMFAEEHEMREVRATCIQIGDNYDNDEENGDASEVEEGDGEFVIIINSLIFLFF